MPDKISTPIGELEFKDGAPNAATAQKLYDNLFFEYFHGDNGAGLGASHQTGWTGVIARAMHLFATMTPEQALKGGKTSYFKTQGVQPEKVK
jgi:hypothetical protein